MRLIIAVKSCVRDMEAGFHTAIRNTWGAELKARGIPTYFFTGGQGLEEDEIHVDAPDDYMGLPHKTRGICQFATAVSDHVFLCDNDTIITVDRFVDAAYKQDYVGFFNRDKIRERFNYRDRHGVYMGIYPWCSGGLGYFLSRKASLAVAKAVPTLWAEDMHVGQVLGPLDMTMAHLDLKNDTTWHYRKSKKFPQFTPDILYRMHREGPNRFYNEAFE